MRVNVMDDLVGRTSEGVDRNSSLSKGNPAAVVQRTSFVIAAFGATGAVMVGEINL